MTSIDLEEAGVGYKVIGKIQHQDPIFAKSNSFIVTNFVQHIHTLFRSTKTHRKSPPSTKSTHIHQHARLGFSLVVC